MSLPGKNNRIIFLLSLFFLIDLLKPSHYALNSEFLFLGIIFIGLNLIPSSAVSLAVGFGYLKDAFASGGLPFNMLEFTLLTVIIQFFKYSCATFTSRLILISLIIVIHIALNSLNISGFYFLYSVLFLIHSLIFYFLVNLIFKKCANIYPTNYI